MLRKNVEIVATRRHILKLECTNFQFGWGSAPDPAEEAHSAPQTPLAGFKGPTSKGKDGRGREGAIEGKKKTNDVEGKGKGRGRKEVRGGKAWPDL